MIPLDRLMTQAYHIKDITVFVYRDNDTFLVSGTLNAEEATLILKYGYEANKPVLLREFKLCMIDAVRSGAGRGTWFCFTVIRYSGLFCRVGYRILFERFKVPFDVFVLHIVNIILHGFEM